MSPARKQPDTSTYAGRFAVRLRTLREKAKLTPPTLAEMTGIPIRTIYNWESAIAFPPVEQFPKLAETLKLKSVRLLFPEK